MASGTALIQSNGLWDVQTDADVLISAGGTPSFVNAGTFRKSAGAATTIMGVAFSGGGQVEVQTGTLEFSQNATHSGSITVSPGAVLQLAGGVQTLTATSSVSAPTVVFSGATTTVQGQFSVTGQTTVSGGSTTFEASSAIASVGDLAVSAGTLALGSGEPVSVSSLTMTGGTLTGSDAVTVAGGASWSSGFLSGSGSLTIGGPLSISGDLSKTLSQRTLIVNGVTWTGSAGLLTNGAALIQSNGLWDVQTDADITVSGGGTPSFVNAGTFRKSSGAGTTVMDVSYSGGAVEVLTGTLDFSQNATHSGSVTVSPGAALRFSGGVQTLTGVSSLSAPSVSFTGATVTVQGQFSVTGQTSVSNGAATFVPSATIAGLGALSISGGTLALDGGEAVSVPSLTVADGVLTGGDPISVTGGATWSGGTLSGSGDLTVVGPLAISGTIGMFLQTRSLFVGDTTFSGTASVTVSAGAAVHSGGLWDVQTDADLVRGGGAAVTFDNAGTFRKSAGGGLTGVGLSFTNAGTVEASSGALSFSEGYVQTSGLTRLAGGSIAAAPGLDLQGGRLEGVGTITGDVTSGGDVAPGLSPGSLTIVGDYAQAGPGTYEVEVGGPSPGTQHDQIVVGGSGAASLGGTLAVSLVDGFTPTNGDSFSIMTMASRTGTFESLLAPPPGAGLEWKLVYGATSVVLAVGPVANADVRLTMTDSPDPVPVGGDLRYTITAHNEGPDPATGSVVTDVLPASVTFAAASTTLGSCGESGGTVSCALGTLESAQQAVIQIDVHPTQITAAVTNTATIAAEPFDGVPSNNAAGATTRVDPACPDADADGAAVCGAGCLPLPGDVCGDCADSNPARRPGIPEVCNDVDEDCDQLVDEGLASVPEACNGLDENCNGLVDEGDPEGGASCAAGGVGVCDVGALTCLGGSLVCARVTGPGPEACNGLDDDCDGVADEGRDSDRDGLDDCADDCPDAYDPPEDCDGLPGTPDEQCDSDSDGAGDACDCAPFDAADPPPPEVADTLLASQSGPTTTLTWQPVAGVSSYNVYRGYRIQESPFAYDQHCLAGGARAAAASETAVPRPLTILYYLVSSRCGESGESVLGRASSGAPVAQPFTCPPPAGDPDGDGTEEPFDDCPGFRNTSQSDVDADGLGDVCDNCPAAANPGQEDADLDGAGDACDPP